MSSAAFQADVNAASDAGTIVLVIDESSAMTSPIGGGTKSKAESVATAVNALLNQLAAGPPVQVGLIGYRQAEAGEPGATSRWAGPLQGQILVSSAELPQMPVTVEQRVRRIPGPGGVGVVREETIQFPIWYIPEPNGQGAFAEALECCRAVLDGACRPGGKPPLVLHICGDLPPADVSRSEAILTSLGAGVLWCHIQLNSIGRIPATLYPATDQHLAGDEAVALFGASCILPSALNNALQAAQVALTPNARGIVGQAAMGDLIRFLSLAKAYAAAPQETFATSTVAATAAGAAPAPLPAPSAAPAAAPAVISAPSASETYDRVAFVLVLDRSELDAQAGAWKRRQDHANELLGQIAKRAGGDIDAGLVVYDDSGLEVGIGGEAPAPCVSDGDLVEAALRVEDCLEKVSNGIGGLIEVKRTRPVFVDSAAGGPCTDLPGVFDAALDLANAAIANCADQRVLPVLLHLTGGDFTPDAIAAVGGRVTPLDELLVYHAIIPEVPQRTLAYPEATGRIDDPRTLAFWQITSPLAGAAEIAKTRRTITAEARGITSCAKFDLLLPSLKAILPSTS